MTQKVHMTRLRKVLSGLAQSQSYSTIIKDVAVSKAFVSKIAGRIRSLHLDIATLLALDDQALHDTLYERPASQCVEPDWDSLIGEQMKKKGNYTAIFLYERYREQVDRSDRCMAYSTFCQRFKQYRTSQACLERYTNCEHQPGESMEIDFAGDTLSWCDKNGTPLKASIFVCALSFSGLIFACATSNQKSHNWLHGITQALAYFGGVPRVLIMDNAKALVSKPSDDGGIIHPCVADCCRHYGMVPYACKAYSPKGKSRVEASVGLVQRHVLAQLRHSFHTIHCRDIDELNSKYIFPLLDKLNERPMHGLKKGLTRRGLFESVERAALSAWSADNPYDYGEWGRCHVGKDHCFRYCARDDTSIVHRYSVPATYVNRYVDVKATHNDELIVFDCDSNQEICRHKWYQTRCKNQRHMLEEHKSEIERLLGQSPEYFIAQLIALGLEADLSTRMVELIWRLQPKAGLAANRCLRIIQFCRKHSDNMAALQHVLRLGCDSQDLRIPLLNKRLQSTLKRLSETNAAQTALAKMAQYQSPNHDNIRCNYV